MKTDLTRPTVYHALSTYIHTRELASLQAVIAEVERLTRIEATARAYLAAYDAGDTMAHAERDALRVALQETTP